LRDLSNSETDRIRKMKIKKEGKEIYGKWKERGERIYFLFLSYRL